MVSGFASERRPASTGTGVRHRVGLTVRHQSESPLQSTLWLSDCHKVDFIKHHDAYCSIGGCNDRGKDGDRAAGRVIAYVLSRGINIIDDPLITTKPKKALSFAVYRGLWRILFALGASAENLEGSLKTDVSVDAALRAALLRYAAGELDAAKQTASLIGSGEIFRRRLSNLVEDHFGLKSEVLAE
jgi:hypothetical protein